MWMNWIAAVQILLLEALRLFLFDGKEAFVIGADER